MYVFQLIGLSRRPLAVGIAGATEATAEAAYHEVLVPIWKTLSFLEKRKKKWKEN